MATLRRLSQGCNYTGSPDHSEWDHLCASCRTILQDQPDQLIIKPGPSFQVERARREMEAKLKQVEDRLRETEASERWLQEQIVFLSAWNPVVMNTGWTDIVVQSGGKIINAHRAVLAAKSEVILKKIKGNPDQALNLRISPDALDTFLRYFYTGTISRRDLQCYAAKVLTAAARYGVRSLQLIAERYIAEHVSRGTALSAWELGVEHKSEVIKDAVIEVLGKDLPGVARLAEYRTYRRQKDPKLLVGLFESLIVRIV